MLLIPCPWCGPRDEIEFRYGGQAHVAYPQDPDALDDDQWADFLFMRDNPKGDFAERWYHSAGCRRWFNVVRNTATHEILAVYRVGEARPHVTADLPATPCGEAIIGSGNDAVKVMQAGETAEGLTGQSFRAREAGA